jgi:putative DNA primase/helicase
MSGADDLKAARQEADERRDGKPEIVAVTGSDVAPANVRWLWRNWIPLCMQTALVGMPGFGKSTFANKIAAQTTRGELDGDLYGEPADALIISYEDVIAERLRPMAEAAGADLDRVHFLRCRETGRVIDLTTQLPLIEELTVEYQARLLVIDPLVAGLPHGQIDSHKDQSVRSALAPLIALAERRDLALLTIAHPSKANMSALLAHGGSMGFVGAPRSILIFGPDPNHEQGAHGRARVLAHAKSNVGKLQRSRQVGIMPHVLDPFGARIETSVAVIGDDCEISADELVHPDRRAASPRVRAERFLRELLADGPHKADEVISLAADADISERTLRRAKSELGVRALQKPVRVWWWELPPEDEDDGSEGE